MGLDQLTPLPNWVLVSLLDVVIGAARACRRWLKEQPPPWLVTEPAVFLDDASCVTPVTGWCARRGGQDAVAILVSRSAMELRVRDALSERANLYFTSTWAELRRVVAGVSPCAIIADPLADPSGYPERHLDEFLVARRPPIILYTRRTPQLGTILLGLEARGISAVIVRRYDDDSSDRFVAALAAVHVARDSNGRPLPGGARAIKTRRGGRVKPVVAVLVSRSKMATQLRDALGERAELRFARTWAELDWIVASESPVAIFADPLADESGNPVRHLLEFTGVLHLPVILYTCIVPRIGSMLLRLPKYGFRDMIVHQYGDEPSRLVAALAGVAAQGSGPPLRAA